MLLIAHRKIMQACRATGNEKIDYLSFENEKTSKLIL